LACLTHAALVALRLIFLQAFSALASFCARVRGLGAGAFTGARLPAPLKLWLEGAPKMSGWGAGAARQASAVPHGGGVAAAGLAQGAEAEQTWAS
jgi:hypothetical protein